MANQSSSSTDEYPASFEQRNKKKQLPYEVEDKEVSQTQLAAVKVTSQNASGMKQACMDCLQLMGLTKNALQFCIDMIWKLMWY